MDAYSPDSIVHSLHINLIMHAHVPSWLTRTRSESFIAPFKSKPGVIGRCIRGLRCMSGPRPAHLSCCVS